MPEEVDAIRSALAEFGIPRDATLVVHSAIAPLSRRGVRAEHIIETLLECVSNGNLVMPTMTWRTVTPDSPNWDELETPSHTGVLSEIFRLNYASARSIHPTHSVAGYGRDVITLLSRHHVDETPVSANSPYGLMRDYDAYVLLLGVGLECCTAIHLPEETIDMNRYVCAPEYAELYRCRDRGGVVRDVRTRRHRRLDRHFARFGPPLAARGLLKEGNIHGYPYRIVGLASLLRDVFQALIADPRATLREGSGTLAEIVD